MFMSASFGFLGVCLNVSRRARAFLYIRFWAPLGVSQSASRRLWTCSCDSPRYFAFPKASLSSFPVFACLRHVWVCLAAYPSASQGRSDYLTASLRIFARL